MSFFYIFNHDEVQFDLSLMVIEKNLNLRSKVIEYSDGQRTTAHTHIHLKDPQNRVFIMFYALLRHFKF